MSNLSTLPDKALARAIAHARTRRDTYDAGHVPQDVLKRLRDLLAEQARRRKAR